MMTVELTLHNIPTSLPHCFPVKASVDSKDLDLVRLVLGELREKVTVKVTIIE